MTLIVVDPALTLQLDAVGQQCLPFSLVGISLEIKEASGKAVEDMGGAGTYSKEL